MMSAAYALTYFGIPIPFRREAWFCKDCRHQWSDTNEPLPSLQWPLIATLWSFDFLAAIVIFFAGIDRLAIWLWIAFVAISGASLTRFATHRRFMQAFIVGFVVGCVDWLAVCSYYYRQGGAILNSTAPIVFPYGISYIATFQGIIIVAVTWSVATLVRRRGQRIQKT